MEKGMGEREDKEDEELVKRMIEAVEGEGEEKRVFPKAEEENEAFERLEREGRNYIQLGYRFSIGGIYVFKYNGEALS